MLQHHRTTAMLPIFIDRGAQHAPEHAAATSGCLVAALSFAAALSLGFGWRLPCHRPLLEIGAGPARPELDRP
jgi:hypothetical protein